MSAIRHPAGLSDDALLARCDVQRTRRSGPGGQHRNRSSTAVVLTHRPTGLRAEASERRSQAQNQRTALRRLRIKLAIEHRASAEGAPSELWRSRCSGGRISINPGHEDFPLLLAEAMDLLAECDWSPAAAADRLGCSSSQLVKLLAREAAALAHVNDQRRSRRMHPLK